MAQHLSDALETDCSLLAGYGCGERGPFLVIDRLDTDPWQRQWFAPRERTFTLEAHRDRHCTGRHDLATGQSSPCPIRAALPEGALEQCSACFVVTGFNPAFYNSPQISDAQRRRNREPHSVYLAYFGGGVFKVGMTLAARGRSRLLEQGARMAAILATHPSAERARELEEHVARRHEVAESVRAARKRQLLFSPFSPALVRAELERRIADIAEQRPEVDADAEIMSLDPFYGGPGLLASDAMDLTETEPLAISGHCAGMIGDVLIAEQGGRRFMISVGTMIGRRISLTHRERPNRFVGQLGLPF